jgi:hypothetical protein
VSFDPSPEEIVARARKALGHRTQYKLGRGGVYGKSSAEWTSRSSDCSGFVSWVMQVQRFAPWRKGVVWFETTNIWRDATGPQRWFEPLDEPEVGCMVVYPDRGNGQGHIGVVTSVGPTRFDVVDCSLGSWNKMRDAIKERPGESVFTLGKGRVFCRIKR